jgi:hypothetical protein
VVKALPSVQASSPTRQGGSPAAAADQAVKGVSGGSLNTPTQAGAAAPSDGGASRNSADAGPGGNAPAIERSRAAPPRHWLARVWPAVALGPFRDVLESMWIRLAAAASSSLALREETGGLIGLADDGPATNSPPGAPASASHPGGADISLPGGAAIPLFIAVLFAAVVTALLLGTVRRELGALHRWWPH